MLRVIVFYNGAVTPCVMCPGPWGGSGHGTLRHNINSGQGGHSTGRRFLQAETRDSPVAIVTVTQAPGLSPEDASPLTTCELVPVFILWPSLLGAWER